MFENVEDYNLRTPNDEQLMAITHEGGALLSAGAGSGKTFVLVEHIFYLFEKKYNSYKGVGVDEVVSKLKSDFSKIVIMTFTNKAAGELTLRLRKRFDLALRRAEHNLESISIEVLEKSYDVIEQMFVGTIHGFCFRLLKSGALSVQGGELDIINEYETQEKIKKIINLWIDHNSDKENKELVQLLLLNKKNFIASMTSIFSDPDLRQRWVISNDEVSLHTTKVACEKLLE